jgi:hypothetical protein
MKQTIIDILNKLKEIPELKYVRVFNNQFQYLESRDIEAFLFPCAFLEIVPQSYQPLLNGYSQSDVDFRIHLGHEQYDSLDGNMEQNLDVFDLRNLVLKKLTLFKPSMCSELFKVNEEQDYTHTGIYKYIIDFRGGVIDKEASNLIEPILIEPLDLSLEVFFVYPQFDFGFNDDFAGGYLTPDIDKREIIIN